MSKRRWLIVKMYDEVKRIRIEVWILGASHFYFLGKSRIRGYTLCGKIGKDEDVDLTILPEASLYDKVMGGFCLYADR